jgi:DNA-binding MarR family transcriptional regulator
MAATSAERTEIDRVLAMVERRGLAPGELRLLFRLLDREASLTELADALGRQPGEVSRSGGRLARRGLVRWYHVGPRDETRLTITKDGRARVQALLADADPAAMGLGRMSIGH